MDAQVLAFANEQFDAILFNLVLSVVPDGKTAFHECWRTLRPGGRAVIFDKFIPPAQSLTPGRQMLGKLIRLLGTDPNRRLSEVLDGAAGLRIESDEPSLFHGQYRIIVLRKTFTRS
jgi:SAM-dependent methyltransferase